MNEPSGVSSESVTNGNAHNPGYFDESISGRVLKVTRSLFINYMY